MISPILIAGAPRSGTSMTAGLIAQHGVLAGKCRASNPKYSGKGHFEHRALKRLMRRVLRENGIESIVPSAQGWPSDLSSNPSWPLRVMLEFPEVESGEAWLVKEALILMTWPLWRKAFPGATYVLPRRPHDATVQSMLRHHGLLRLGDEKTLRLWAEMCWQRQDEIAASGAKHVFVDTDSMARGDMNEARRLIESLGLEFDANIAKEWIDPSVWRQAEERGVRLVKGWWFPDGDRLMADEMKPDGSYQREHLEAALKYVRNFSGALDGGAHVGTWSRILSERFAAVLSVEPAEDACHCLMRNMHQFECENVHIIRAALSDAAGRAGMVLEDKEAARGNTGARYAGQGDDVDVITIDSLELEGLDFLKLDIEGAEPAALKGARKTLKRYRPVVLFEDKGFCERFGYERGDSEKYLTSLGAKFLERVGCDQVWGWPH